MQTAIKTHLSQPMGVGAFDGQQGISSIVASAVADADMSSIIADIDASDIDTSDIAASDIGPAMARRANGAKTRPAIMTIASRRRMVIWWFTPQNPTDASKLKASQTDDAVARKPAKGATRRETAAARPGEKPPLPKLLNMPAGSDLRHQPFTIRMGGALAFDKDINKS